MNLWGQGVEIVAKIFMFGFQVDKGCTCDG